MLNGLIEAALRGELTTAQAGRLANENPEILALALFAASKHIAEQEARIAQLQGVSSTHASPSTPSGMVPVYTNPNTPKRRKKPGTGKDHRREKPERIDDHQTHAHGMPHDPLLSHKVDSFVKTQNR